MKSNFKSNNDLLLQFFIIIIFVWVRRKFTRKLSIDKLFSPHFQGVITEPQFMIVSEFMEGGSLVKLLHEKTLTISVAETKKIVSGIALGMMHLHSQEIIHRDLAARSIVLLLLFQCYFSFLIPLLNSLHFYAPSYSSTILTFYVFFIL